MKTLVLIVPNGFGRCLTFDIMGGKEGGNQFFKLMLTSIIDKIYNRHYDSSFVL